MMGKSYAILQPCRRAGVRILDIDVVVFAALERQWAYFQLAVFGCDLEILPLFHLYVDYYVFGEWAELGHGSRILIPFPGDQFIPDRKSTRLNSSHLGISYAV